MHGVGEHMECRGKDDEEETQGVLKVLYKGLRGCCKIEDRLSILQQLPFFFLKLQQCTYVFGEVICEITFDPALSDIG